MLDQFYKFGADQTIVRFAGEHRSRWGYHPCPYEHSMKLKRLAYLTLRHRQLSKAYWRWARKQAQNRVMRQKVRDDAGRVVGWKIIGMTPEPKKPFQWESAAIPMYQWSDVRKIEKTAREDYGKARHPVEHPDMVPVLTLNPPAVDGLLAEYENWAKEQNVK